MHALSSDATRPAPATREVNQVRLASPILVGRHMEQQRLLAVATCPPGLAIVEGDAGLGKSRLIHETLQRPELSGVHVVVTKCSPMSDSKPLGPLVEALAECGEIVGPVARAAPAATPELFGDARSERHALFRSVAETFGRLGPTVCVVEDLQWADESTVEFLTYLTVQLPPLLTVIGSFRREELPVSSALRALTARLAPHIATTHIDLSPLNPDDVRRLVGAILETNEVSEAFAGQVHGATAGIPFAVEELMRLAQERGDIVRRHGRWRRLPVERLKLPPAIRDTVLARVGRLSESARRAVEAAAVLQEPASEQTLRAVAELDTETAGYALEEALRHAVLDECAPLRYGFRHTLAREAVSQSLPAGRRALLNLRAAEALQRDGDASLARLARHYREAGRPREWAHYGEAAGDLAVAQYNTPAAVRFYLDALRSPALSAADSGRIGAKLGEAAITTSEAADVVIGALRDTLATEDLPRVARGRIRFLLGEVMTGAGSASAGYREQARAVDDLAEAPELASIAMARLAAPWVIEGRLSDHLAWLDRAVATAAAVNDPAVRSQIGFTRAAALLAVGEPDAERVAVRWLDEQMVAIGNSHHLAAMLYSLSSAAFHTGHDVLARQLRQDGIRLFPERLPGPLRTTFEALDIALSWARGDWSGLEGCATSYAEENTYAVTYAALGNIVSGLLALARGANAESAIRLQQGFDAANASGAVPGVPAAAGGLAALRLRQGDADAAYEEAQRGLELVVRKGIWTWAAPVMPAAVDAAAASGRLPQAADLVERFEAGLRGRSAPLGAAALDLCRGVLSQALGDSQTAACLFARSAVAFDRLPRPYLAAQARAREGHALLQAGCKGGAEALRSSLATFELLRATADATDVRRLLRMHSLPLPRPQRSGRRSYGTELSPREREVIGLVAQRWTNPEIARALFMSTKTVDKHVGSAMAKLGVHSRRDLSAMARDV